MNNTIYAESEIQSAFLKLQLTIEELTSTIAKALCQIIENTRKIFLEYWNSLKVSKKHSKIIHLAEHGKTARIRKKNKARLIRLFLQEKYKPG